MEDKIKEILEKIKSVSDFDDYVDFVGTEFKPLLDYITNLQEENNILRQNAEHNDKVVDKARWNEMLYKGRNKKAIKIINDIFKDEEWYENYEYNDLEDVLKEVKKILKGSDKE